MTEIIATLLKFSISEFIRQSPCEDSKVIYTRPLLPPTIQKCQRTKLLRRRAYELENKLVHTSHIRFSFNAVLTAWVGGSMYRRNSFFPQQRFRFCLPFCFHF